MKFHVITLFPEMFDSYLKESILGRAIKERKITVTFTNPRKFVSGKYKKVWPDGNVSQQIDERPYGGGPGMVMMAEPVVSAVESVVKKISKRKKSSFLIINFIPTAPKFTTEKAKKISGKYTDVILICGRYEGIDTRVDKILSTYGRSAEGRKDFDFKKMSIGDYVLTGGEIPAMILIDCISRQVKGVLGNFDSREEERVSSSVMYTRPEVLVYKGKKYKVPKILLSGNHKKIEEWKENSRKN